MFSVLSRKTKRKRETPAHIKPPVTLTISDNLKFGTSIFLPGAPGKPELSPLVIKHLELILTDAC